MLTISKTSTPATSARVRLLSASLGALLLFASAGARAEGASSAQVLDAEGTALLNQRQFSAACPKLAESFRLQPGTGVLLRLALCQELSGQGATARASYLDAAERARTAGDANIVQLAQKRATALEARLSRLVIRLDPSAQGLPNLQVLHDGAPIEVTEPEATLLVDPGSHSIEASALGHKQFQETVSVSESPTSYSITIVLPVALLDAGTSNKPHYESNTAPSSAWSTQKTLAAVAAGVGVAGVSTGTLLGLNVASKMRHARAQCTNGDSGCSQHALELQDQARGTALAADVAFGIGAAGVAAGLVLWFTAPRSAERPLDAQLRAAPWLSAGTLGAQAVGTW